MTTYTREQAAAYLNISPSALDILVDSCEIPAAKIAKGWVFRHEDLSAYLEKEVRLQTEVRSSARKAGKPVKQETAVGRIMHKRRLPALPA